MHLELSRRAPGAAMRFDARRGAWWADVAAPAVKRVEYRFSVRTDGGEWQQWCDPANPLRARGPFGERSVLERPGYQPSAWLADDSPPGTTVDMIVRATAIGADVPVMVWTSAGHGRGSDLPVIVAHDGIELAHYADLLRFLATLPPLHAVLLGPVHRDDEYSASAAYARALARQILPTVSAHVRIPDDRSRRVGMGVSLGAVAILHAHRVYPDLFGGMFLQSGSFFQRATDPQETGFSRFARISRFVRSVLVADRFPHPVPVGMTCGAEENLVNNEAMAATLAAQGYDVALAAVADTHTWVGWRDGFDPHLRSFLAGLWT